MRRCPGPECLYGSGPWVLLCGRRPFSLLRAHECLDGSFEKVVGCCADSSNNDVVTCSLAKPNDAGIHFAATYLCHKAVMIWIEGKIETSCNRRYERKSQLSDLALFHLHLAPRRCRAIFVRQEWGGVLVFVQYSHDDPASGLLVN